MAPALAATARPAGVLPVRVTAFTAGDAMIASTRFDCTRRARKSGGGKPASLKICSMASAQPLTLPACLRRPALPAMRAGAAKRKTCQNGKFHGMIASTGPRGRNATKLLPASVATTSGARKRSALSA